MGNALLIGVGIFMIAMISLGFNRGLVKMAFSLVSVFAVIILVNILTPTTKELLKATPVYEAVYDQVEKYVDENIAQATEDMTQSGVNAQEMIIKQLPLPNSVKESLAENNTQDKYAQMEVDSFSAYIAESIADMINGAMSFVFLYVIITVLLKCLIILLDIITILPVVSTFNAIGGAILGLTESVVILWIACIVVTAFSATSWGQQICTMISNNSLLSLIYDNNMIQHMIEGVLKF